MTCNYLVEKCDVKTGIWEKVPGLVSNNSIQVRNLTEGRQYTFRVRAVNMLGSSEPGEVSSAVTAKNPYERGLRLGFMEVVNLNKLKDSIKFLSFPDGMFLIPVKLGTENRIVIKPSIIFLA
ncbi:unnamed protein product [Protopolystoma xenopodis]|uniref:Fibronectin type-III domain-containing protein n=1 Tax=Protopolystoma xenopodis TaxID=117903 RepID=A0A448WWK9_9PLAT|nr:unnamed protein product [Protopolystoma xenopodis]